jgi:hypothetical protein
MSARASVSTGHHPDGCSHDRKAPLKNRKREVEVEGEVKNGKTV